MNCLKITLKLWMKKEVYGNLNHNFSPIRRQKGNCILYTAQGNVMTAEWPRRAPTAHVVAETLV
jgi:hypothetical protein